MYASSVRRSANFALANGAQIPKLGFGTWKMSKEQATPAVAHAIKTGYRHIGTFFLAHKMFHEMQFRVGIRG